MNIKKTWIITIVAVLAIFMFAVKPQFAFAQNSNDENRNTAKRMRYLQTVYEFLQEYYVEEVDPSILYKGAMKGMLNSLEDPYTEYIENDSMIGKNLQDTTTGTFGGIGVTITKPKESTPDKQAYVEVMSPIDGTPGAKAGLRSGDYITEIDGKPTDTMTMDDVLSTLRGKVGTTVDLKILRGKNLNFNLTIVRAKIEVPTVKHGMINKDIGYIKLIEFNPNSAPKMIEAIKDLEKQGYKKLIFDLRNNPGGLITSAVDVASLFLDEGVVVSTKSRIESENRVFYVNKHSKKVKKDIPIIVLVNGGSASASEIVSGALKDHKRAYLIGKKTFGKGLVQTIFQLDANESFKLTVAKYYSPSDANINKIGIPPDYEIDIPIINEDEEEHVVKLYESKKMEKFAKSKKIITTSDIHAYAKTLSMDYPIRKQILEVLIKTEVDRYRQNNLVDVDFDPQLKKAVNLLNTKDVNTLSKKTKTVFELQQEKEESK